MKKNALLVAILLTNLAYADIPPEQQIKSITITEITHAKDNIVNPIVAQAIKEAQEGAEEAKKTEDKEEEEDKPAPVDHLERASKVISVAKEFVALGEAVYELVKKGKPTNVTEYAPVSVVPKNVDKTPVDPFELEGFSVPVEKKYVASVRNVNGKEVVRFEYMIVYSYGGSYNGKGKYISSATLIPGSIKTSFGWDFNSEMRVSGIMNHGTKENPVVGLLLTVKYAVKSWTTAFERNDTIHITGNGELKTFAAK